MKAFFAQQITNAFMKKASKTTYFIESSIVEIISSVLCNSSNISNNWMKQFVVVEEDLVDAYNGQINFLKDNGDLFKAVNKHMKQFNLVVCLLARGISFQACSGILEDVAQESRSHIFGYTSPGDIGHIVRQVVGDRKSTRLNSSHRNTSRMPSSA